MQQALTLFDLQSLQSMESTQTISLYVNGEVRHCSPETSLPDLLQQLGMNPRLVAVEYNGEILHRQFWESTPIQEGDRLEIVTIVGGG
jgi:sulfur carrier protein